MSDAPVPKNVFFAILVAGILQFVHDFPLLPDRMASHFGASGNANGWMTKSQFLVTYAALIVPALVLEFWMPRRLGRMADKSLNLPNKQYWLAPERRAETLAYFGKFFAWYGCAFLAMEVFAMGLATRANLQSPPLLPTGPILFAIVAFTLFNIVWIAAMLRRFSKIPQV